jgi:hypothetical protein
MNLTSGLVICYTNTTLVIQLQMNVCLAIINDAFNLINL